MKQLLLFFFLSTLLLSCNSQKTHDIELDSLVTMLVGKFSNKEQVKDDASFAYLNLINIRIWQDRPGYWVYSEVFDAKQDEYIYSQRIVHYERADSSRFKSTSYSIRNVKDYQSGWNNPKVFNKLTLDSLIIRTGCEVYFNKKTSTIYSGKTIKGSCISTIKSIDYITSSFVVSKDKISIWTRGYNHKGKQVWGKFKGPYKYKKVFKN